MRSSGKHSPGTELRQTAWKGLFHALEVRAFAGRGWLGGGRWLGRRRWRLDTIFLGGKLNAATILACVHREHRTHWNDNRLAFSAEARKEGDGLVAEFELVDGLRMDIEHDLAILDEGMRHLHAGHRGIDRDLWREAAIESPFVQRADQVRTGGTIGWHGDYEKQACTMSIAPIQAPLLAQWTLTVPGKIIELGKAGLHIMN